MLADLVPREKYALLSVNSKGRECLFSRGTRRVDFKTKN